MVFQLVKLFQFLALDWVRTALNTVFLGPGSTAANNGYMSVPTNSYNNNSQNGSDVRLISSTPSMTDSRQGSTIL